MLYTFVYTVSLSLRMPAATSIKAFSLVLQIVAFSNILFAFTAYSVLLVLARHVFLICCAAMAPCDEVETKIACTSKENSIEKTMRAT